MRYFKYQCGDQMGSVWSMFKELADISEFDRNPQERGRCLYGHTMETLDSLMHKAERGVNLTSEEFCLRAYELQCQRNDDTQQMIDADKCLAIIDEADEKEDQRLGYGQVSSRNLKTYEELYDEVDNSDVFDRYMSTLYSVNKVYITEQGVDIIVMLKSALKGIPMAVEGLTSLINKDSRLRSIVYGLCDSSENGHLLKQLNSSAAY